VLSVTVLCLAVLVGLLASGLLGRSGIIETVVNLMAKAGWYEGIGLGPATISEANRANMFKYADLPSLQGQVALITGANIGLGKQSAIELARVGATVVIACRTEKKCSAAAAAIRIEAGVSGDKIDHFVCDLASLKSVQTFTDEFKAKYDRLDMFIANAGTTFYRERAMTTDGIELMFGVNHVAHHLMTRNLLNLLQGTAEKYGSARIVIVSSCAHYHSVSNGVYLSMDDINDESKYNGYTFYAMSKLANLLFAQELAERTRGSDVIVSAVHPGTVKTNVTTEVKLRLTDFFQKNLPLALPLVKLVITGFDKVERTLTWDVKDGALTQVYLAGSRDVLDKSFVSGRYFHPIAQVVPTSPHASGDQGKKLRNELWEFTERILTERGF